MPKKTTAIRWTDDQLAAYQALQGARTPAVAHAAGAESVPKRAASDAKSRMQALGRLKTGEMNKTEAEYGVVLAGDPTVAWHKFEGFKLRLADSTFYTPDYAVMRTDGALECHEVKGHWQDDAKVKIKVAASLYPFAFIAVKKRAKKDGGGFSREEF